MEELLKLKYTLDSINPDIDKVPLDLLDEINEVLQYALGWCHGWLANKARSGLAGTQAAKGQVLNPPTANANR